MSEFPSENIKTPRRGMTSVEATAYLAEQFPDVTHWTCWIPNFSQRSSLQALVGTDASIDKGQAGIWKWARVPTTYPVPHYWTGEVDDEYLEHGWVGVLRIEIPSGGHFLLFTYLDSQGYVGHRYFASTTDRLMLHRFANDLNEHFFPRKPDRVHISVHGSRPIILDAAPDEQPILPQSLLQDIEGQVFSFFQDQEAYRQLQLRHRRGFLFVGPPGTGKTMTIRHLIRECFRRYKPSISTLRVNRSTDESDLDSLFSEAIRRAPGIVILEDLDSLTSEAGISRSAFLAQLDGLSTADGLLIIGTTNNPEKIDPALIHRPSRFDRVWHFPLPDYDLRVSYLVRAFESLDSNAIESLSERTNGWSFAYLSELRTTAAIRALNRGTRTVTAEVAEEAHELLDAQFRAGRKNHREEAEATVGFQLNMA